MSWTSFASEVRGVDVAHFEVLQDLRLSRVSATSARASSSTISRLLSFSAFGQSYELQLESNDRLLAGMARDALSQDVELYRGKIAGNADSWVRVVMYNDEPRGLIWDGTDLLAIEAPGDSLVATTEPVIFRFADTYALPGTLSCGASDTSGNGATVYQGLLGELSAVALQAAGATSQIEISAIGDFQFANSISGDPAVAIATRLNNVDGIFSAQVGVQLVLQETEIFAIQGTEPFSSTTAAQTLLNELGQYREATFIHRSRGLTHLFTGRNLDGGNVGTGYSSLLCWDHFGSGLTQGTHGSATDSLIAAHEFGHNFGAPHDAVPGSPCQAVPATFLMAPQLNNSSQFSDCSIVQMQPVIAAASCITPLPSTDVSIAPRAVLPVILLGNNVSANFDVRNSGTDPVTNVSVNVSLPNNVTILSATASAGSCSNGAGIVDCQLGTIASGATITVGILSVTSMVGTGSFDAVVTADADDNPGNDQASIQVTVAPAIDLVVNLPSTTSLLVGQSTTLTIPIDNAAVLDASGLVLTIAFDAGLRADSASWGIGNCTIAVQQINCQAASLSAQSSTTLSLGVSAITAGRQNYNVVLTAAEADRDPSNNNVTGSVTVNTPVVSNRGGGGGTGVAFLAALLWVSYRRRVTAC